ncbi:MAG: FAD-dependent thymidylate synthase [Roseiflexus sp.]
MEPTIGEPWGDRFSETERALLAPFVTDVDAPVFGLRNLPDVVRGALFSRYSRSDKSLRRILLDEFIQAPEADFQSIVALSADAAAHQIVAVHRAEAFYERVLIGYGDDSVAELGGAHVACEGVSNIAAKALEDSRIGISALEKSTRYVAFNRKVEGRYRYLREAAIMASPHARAYETAMDALFDTYSGLIEPTLAAVRAQTPREPTVSERAYAGATRAKTFDLLRGLLPMATLTNVGLFGNGRAFEYLLTKLSASPLAELQSLATALQRALDDQIPSFVKRAKSERGRAYQAYLRETRQQVRALAAAAAHRLTEVASPSPGVTLVAFDPDAEVRVVAAILYPHLDISLEDAYAYAERLSADERASLIRAYVGRRAGRFHRPGRAFEEARYTFDLLVDIGAYRDLQRHRMLTQDRQRFGVQHGYVVPPEIDEYRLGAPFRAALDQTGDAVAAIAADLPEEAQYAVPFAYRVRWRATLNLREAYHLCELRSAPQGHPGYRRIAQEMYRQIAAVHPLLAEGMRFVDMHEYALERLDAESRLDEKQRKQTE